MKDEATINSIVLTGNESAEYICNAWIFEGRTYLPIDGTV